jgi:hypothetical protein
MCNVEKKFQQFFYSSQDFGPDPALKMDDKGENLQN